MEGNNQQKRAKNFINSEKRLLISVASEFIDTVENKQTDAQSVQMKKKTWDIITERFNRTSITGSRTSKQLRALYDSLKKIAKKNCGIPRTAPSVRNEVEPSKILELLKVAVSTNAVDERIPVPVQVSNSPHQLVLLTSVSDLSAQCPGDGAAVNEESNLDPLNFTPGSTNEEAEEANSISIDCSPEHDENFEEVKCNTLNILSSPKKEQEVANSELNPEPQNFSLDFANEDNTSQLEGTSQTCHEEPPASKSESQSLKRRGVQMIADRFIKRKNVKDTYDMELHEQKMRLLRKEVEIKEIELENRVTEIEMTKKIRQLEYEIKQNELEIVQMDKNIKQMELKVKTDQYSEYSNS